jgi:hypothetical protein
VSCGPTEKGDDDDVVAAAFMMMLMMTTTMMMMMMMFSYAPSMVVNVRRSVLATEQFRFFLFCGSFFIVLFLLSFTSFFMSFSL